MKQEYIDRVYNWAKAKGIIDNSYPAAQFNKTCEEVDELQAAILADNLAEQADAVGDIIVTLLNFCSLAGLDINTCIEGAISTIEKRSGKMVGGIFVKEETIEAMKVGYDYLNTNSDKESLRQKKKTYTHFSKKDKSHE
jgi:NTP pyrophosphatase (non-canonical NTP hydrolase)